ncbi:hypothetical protein OIO90_002053 [Microbotryomycetes sp. JL221]|nr:hypothetical protein OIO90_002053 [Microbotryomycetes sp. JL221]
MTSEAHTTLPLTRESIQHAHSIIKPLIHQTPLLTSSTLSSSTQNGSNVLLFKAENLQRGGAFKARGAFYNLECLTSQQLEQGVCTHSSGNHAGALALAARAKQVKCYIVMPKDSSQPKIEAAISYGAHVTFCEPTAEARQSTLEQVQIQTGATFVPPYDAVNTILGQGTTFLEIHEQAKQLGYNQIGAIVSPVGGGGLTSGVSLAAKGTGVRVFAAGFQYDPFQEPAGADDCAKGIAQGSRVTHFKPQTIADGLRTPIGEINFPIIQKNVEAILTVTDEEIIQAQRLLWERLKLIVEPSGAVAFAAVRSQAFKELKVEGPVAIILSGGNIDLSKPLPWQK